MGAKSNAEISGFAKVMLAKTFHDIWLAIRRSIHRVLGKKVVPGVGAHPLSNGLHAWCIFLYSRSSPSLQNVMVIPSSLLNSLLSRLIFTDSQTILALLLCNRLLSRTASYNNSTTEYVQAVVHATLQALSDNMRWGNCKANGNSQYNFESN